MYRCVYLLVCCPSGFTTDRNAEERGGERGQWYSSQGYLHTLHTPHTLHGTSRGGNTAGAGAGFPRGNDDSVKRLSSRWPAAVAMRTDRHSIARMNQKSKLGRRKIM
jgi:hypothetical protein